MPTIRLRMTLEYDGSAFLGWQKQPQGVTVQSALESALQERFQQRMVVIGSGRTDTGVHAYGQVAHFDLTIDEELDLAALKLSLSRMLWPEIQIHRLERCTKDFHARYSAKGKHYLYRISEQHRPLMQRITSHYLYPLDGNLLQQGCSLMQGRHDFKAFANENDRGVAAHDSVREIFSIQPLRLGAFWELHFVGEGFLYKMVRNCSALLLEIAAKRKPLSAITSAFSSKQRPSKLACAAPQGLTLVEVFYEEQATKKRIEQLDQMARSEVATQGATKEPSLPSPPPTPFLLR